MSRILFALLVVAVATMPAAAAAPDDPGVPNATTTVEQADDRTVRISPATRITDYTYQNGVWRVTVESEISTTLTIAEATRMDEGGARSFRIRQYRVQRGTSTVTFQADRVDGMAAISVTTPESIQGGEGAYVQAGDAVGNPLADTSPTLGWFGGAGVAVLSFVGAAVMVMRSERGEPREL
jgi:hypothetical protein